MYLVFRSRREKTTDNLFMSNLLTSTVQMCTAECLNITSFFNPQFNFGLVIDDQVLKLSLRVFCFFWHRKCYIVHCRLSLGDRLSSGSSRVSGIGQFDHRIEYKLRCCHRLQRCMIVSCRRAIVHNDRTFLLALCNGICASVACFFAGFLLLRCAAYRNNVDFVSRECCWNIATSMVLQAKFKANENAL